MIDRITPLNTPAKYSALTNPTMPLYARMNGGTQTIASTSRRFFGLLSEPRLWNLSKMLVRKLPPKPQ
ncbi:hypothetical protein D3C72_2477980 [compost metagenome]